MVLFDLPEVGDGSCERLDDPYSTWESISRILSDAPVVVEKSSAI